jgi:hypothetical protein
VDNWEYFGAAMFFDREFRSRHFEDTDRVRARPAGGGEGSKPWNAKYHLWSLKILRTFATLITLVNTATQHFSVTALGRQIRVKLSE